MSDEKETPVVPLRVLQGDGQPRVTGEPIEVRRAPEPQVLEVVRLDQVVGELQKQLGALDEQLQLIAVQKTEVFQRIRDVRAAELEAARVAARLIGINPDDTSKMWTLDLPTRTFRRTK